MFQLAKVLVASHGFSITFVFTEYDFNRLHLPSSSIAYPCISFETVSDGFPLVGERPDLWLHIDAFQENVHRNFESLVARVISRRPFVTCIIADYFLPWSQDVSDKYGIPRVLFWPQSLSVFAIYMRTPLLVVEGVMDESIGTVKRGWERRSADLMSSWVSGLPALRGVDLPYFSNRAGFEWISRWLYKLIEQNSKSISKAAYILCNTFYALEDEVIEKLQLPIFPVGPLLPSAFMDGGNDDDTRAGTSFWQEDDCISWLDTHAPNTVLYVSVGSLVNVSETQQHEMALGLKASEQPFLWVVRGYKDAESLAKILPEGYLEEVKDRGRIVPWAPQVLVLSHPAVGGFLTHGGWNSTLEGISMGVPLIMWPWYLDQWTDCRMVTERWKVGLELMTPKDIDYRAEPAPELGRLEVARGVRRLMREDEGKEMRRRGGRLSEEAKRAVMKGGSSSTSFQKWIDHMRMISDDKYSTAK